MAEVATSPRIRRVQRTALALLVLSGVVNYVDRATLAVANPLIREEIGLSLADMGLLLSAFLWAYAFAQLPAGALVDRLGARVMLTVSLCLWSIAQGLGGLVTSFSQFFAARMLLGMSESRFPPGPGQTWKEQRSARARRAASTAYPAFSAGRLPKPRRRV